MYNTCVSSTLSLRCKGSLSYSISDYSYFFNDRFDRNPTSFSSQSCCACCSNSIYRVPINPRFLYGLRQSALIQWSASRRLILGGGDRNYCRLPEYDVGRSCCCGHACPVNERSFSGRRGRLGEGKFRCMVLEEKWGRRRHSRDIDDAEVMLSLLTEDVGEECFGERERNVRSFRRVEVEKRGGAGGSGISFINKKKNVASGLLESKSKSGLESVTIDSREEDYILKEDRRKDDREIILRGEKRRMRKGGSSCSSYYSCSSLGELESDTEVQVRQEGHRGESASGFESNSEESGEVTYDGKTMEEVGIHGEKNGVGAYAASSGVECDWRKKSEKKLTEVSIERTESREKASNKHTRLSDVHDTGYRKHSSSYEQFDGREEISTLGFSADNEVRCRYSKKDDHIGQSESRMKYKHFTGVQEIHDSDEAFCGSEERVSGREENLRAAESLVQETRHKNTKTIGRISQKNEYIINSQKINEVSKIKEIDNKVTSASQRQSEARVKKQDDKYTVISSSVQDTEQHHCMTGQCDSRQMESRRILQQSTETSDTLDIGINRTTALIRQSDARMENLVENANIIVGSSAEAKEQQFQTDRQAIRRTESREESQDTSKISVVHSSDAQVADSQRAFEKRISSQETYSASIVQSNEESMKRHNLTEERLVQIGPRKETQRPTKALSFSEGTKEEASGSQAASTWKSQPTLQYIGMDMGEKSSSQAIVTAPASQLVGRGPLHVEPTSDFAIQEVPSERYRGSRMGETHEEPLNFISHEDALGSADRLQKSSMHVVGEFVEKVTQEMSTSKVQKELVNEGNKRQQESLSQYGSADCKSMEHGSRRSSQSSGAKGPADEIWDVTQLSIQEPAMAEAPERTTPTTKTITKRTGRSLWHIISDIVRLRWTSHLSKGKSSPNKSTSSEAWFSGHELDENSDENVKREKEIMSQGSTVSDQQCLATTPIGSLAEGTSSASSKDKIGHVGEDPPLFTSISETGSSSKGISSVPTDKNYVQSGGALVISSVSMPPSRIIRSPRVDEIPEAGKSDMSASGSVVQEQPSGTGLTEVSGTEGKVGELKRRKLRRNNQVVKDRFDEWEEAYNLESEQRKIDEIFMREAVVEAKKAADMWEVPVGAVLVQHGKIIARGCNLVEELRDSTAHAEMICIREASNLLRTWRLSETTLYVTLEPCPMCAGAILQARVDAVVWGAPNKLLGADGSWIRLFPSGAEGGNGSELNEKPPAPVHPFHPNIVIRRGVLAAECADAMQQFFQRRRRKKDKKPDPPPTPPSCLPMSTHPSKLFTKMHDAFHFMFCL